MGESGALYIGQQHQQRKTNISFSHITTLQHVCKMYHFGLSECFLCVFFSLCLLVPNRIHGGIKWQSSTHNNCLFFPIHVDVFCCSPVCVGEAFMNMVFTKLNTL